MFFSVDSDPYEGFLRALGVIANKQIVPDDPTSDVPIYIEAFHRVLHHGEGHGEEGDSHRFSLPPEQDKSLSVVS